MSISGSTPTANHAGSTAPAGRARHASSVRRFLRHYMEMVVSMVLGMVVLGAPVAAALRLAGGRSEHLASDAPALMLLGMAISMTVPMVAWMRYRGHGWRASAEMSAAMFVPTFTAIAVHAAGLVDDINVVVLAEHAVMLVAMLVVMLLRPSEYSHRAGKS